MARRRTAAASAYAVVGIRGRLEDQGVTQADSSCRADAWNRECLVNHLLSPSFTRVTVASATETAPSSRSREAEFELHHEVEQPMSTPAWQALPRDLQGMNMSLPHAANGWSVAVPLPPNATAAATTT